MMERSRSSPDIIAILQKSITALESTVNVLQHRDHSIPNWIDLTLGSSWVSYLPTEPVLGYWRDSSGIVRLRGIIKGGTLNPNIIATLPVGFRPLTTLRIAIPTSTGFGWVQINPTGAISLVTGSNLWADFSGISFRAEQ
jgi:hypothetical protein